MQTNPAGFRTPHSRSNRLRRLAWNLVYHLLFRPSPRRLGAWRSWLLTCFGAKIGFARLHSSVKIWAPWLLEIGNQVYIDESVNLYNAYGIRIGDRVVISQGTFLCSATHDYETPEYPLAGQEIVISSDCWIAAEAFIGPGVAVGQGAVIGARACVFKNVEAWTVVGGNPARFIKKRQLTNEASSL